MRLVDSKGRQYTAHFKWEPNTCGVTARNHLWKGLTMCWIHLGDCELTTGTGRACGKLAFSRGEAKRSESEPPSKQKHKGHVLAFRRAVESLVSTLSYDEAQRKLDRRALWASYNEAITARRLHQQQQPNPPSDSLSLDLRRREDVVKAIGHVAGHILRLLANG